MSAPDPHFHDPNTVDVDAELPAARKSRRRRSKRHLITDAQHTPEQNRRSREVQYAIMQGLRLPFIALALLFGFVWNNWWIAAVLFTISVPLPWISVMVANGQGEVRDARTKNVYKPAVQREAMRLEAARQAQLDAGGPTTRPTIIDHDDLR